MSRFINFLIVLLGIVFILAACNASEANLTEKGAEEAEIKEETVTETGVSTNTEQDNSTNTEPVPATNTPSNATASQPSEPARANFPNLGPAPEIENEVWLNTETPVTLASQRGKVVLVEFWTFG